MRYKHRINSVLNSVESKLFKKLSSPQKIQDFLDTLPINFEQNGETYMSPRRVMESKTAHCFEGALFAAAVLTYHDHKPLLMDFQTGLNDEDHVVVVFKQHGLWGAISKTNHAVLRYRDPIYKNPRELAMSYFHEYFMDDGRKSLRAYSRPFDLSKYPPEKWIVAREDLHWLVGALDSSKHFPIAAKNLKILRRASQLELKALHLTEWKK
jgi:hypothetical protein